MHVRHATVLDRDVVLELVSKLLVELGGVPLRRDDATPVFHDLISRCEAGFIVLGESDGVAQAVCTVSVLQALRSHGRYAIIQEMYVEPAVRSTGMGTAVLRFALNQAMAAGCHRVELGTPAQGERQIQFYQRSGFTPIGARLCWKPHVQ
jgi:GNAT superfamily N-acetyltransferase